MSITKKLLPLSMMASLLIFTACGGGSGTTEPKDETPTETTKVTVPQKISIDIPNALKNKRSADANIGKLSIDGLQENETVQSYGYQQLTSTISRAEDTIKSVKENMEYLSSMMPDIVKACTDTAENIKCTIPSGEIELTVEGQVLPIGEILYTKQDDSKKYQQIVVLDLKPTIISMGELGIEKDLETVKWSTDENHIETISDVKFSTDSFNMHLIYDKESSGASSMTITDQYAFDDMKGNFTLKLNDKNDVNNTVTVETISTYKFQNESDSFSSKGSVDDNGGYLISRGSFLSEEFAEKETFDANGSLIKSSFCHTDDTCDMNEPNSWKNFDYEEGFVDSFDGDFIDEFSDEDTSNVFESKELNINGGSLQDGFCDLLPPKFNSNDIESGEGVLENSIGLITKFESDISATLFDNNYIDQLDDLKIICFYPIIEHGFDARFIELKGNDRPTLTIKD